MHQTEQPDDGGKLFTLATKTKPPPSPHVWGAQARVAATEALSGHEQMEWHCQRCSLVRITVMPPQGDARREWRWAGSRSQFIDVVTPECIPTIEVQAQSSELTDRGCRP